MVDTGEPSDGEDKSDKILGWIPEPDVPSGGSTPFASSGSLNLSDDSFWNDFDDSDDSSATVEVSEPVAPVTVDAPEVAAPYSVPFPPPPVSRPNRSRPTDSRPTDSPSPQADENAHLRVSPETVTHSEPPPASSAPAPVPTGTNTTYSWADDTVGEDEDTYGRGGDGRRSAGGLSTSAGSRSGGVNNDEYDEDDEDYSFDDEDEEQVARQHQRGKKKKGFFSNSRHDDDSSGGGKKNQKGKKGDKGDGSGLNGGRWKVVALRTAVWVVLVFLLLMGLKQVLAPAKLDATVVSDTVAQQVGYTGFPVAQGENVGQRFLLSYLTFTPGKTNERTEDLTKYLAEGVDDGWVSASFTGADKTAQSVVSGPFMLSPPQPIDSRGYDQVGTCDVKTSACRAMYMFVAQVSNPQAAAATAAQGSANSGSPLSWVYITVPMIATSSEATGVQVSVAGAPAFVPPPSGVTQPEEIALVEDPAATKELSEQLPAFFTAWAASDAASLKKFIPGDTVVAPTLSQGLNGSVVLYAAEGQDAKSSVTNVKVQALPVGSSTSALRLASATVTWRDTLTQVVYTQEYRLGVYKSSAEGGQWYIQDLQGGGFKMVFNSDLKTG